MEIIECRTFEKLIQNKTQLGSNVFEISELNFVVVVAAVLFYLKHVPQEVYWSVRPWLNG